MILFIIAFAFLLGIKHAFDGDHIAAVGTYLTRSQSLGDSFQMSSHWAVGHTLTASIITALMFVFKDVFFSQFLGVFESSVAFMLIALGIIGCLNVRSFHRHTHTHGSLVHAHPHGHGKRSHEHTHLLGIGIVHGLASNDELLLLLTVSLGASSLAGVLAGTIVFSIGVVAGMGIFSIGSRMLVRWGSLYQHVIMGISAIVSIGYGCVLLAGYV